MYYIIYVCSLKFNLVGQRGNHYSMHIIHTGLYRSATKEDMTKHRIQMAEQLLRLCDKLTKEVKLYVCVFVCLCVHVCMYVSMHVYLCLCLCVQLP